MEKIEIGSFILVGILFAFLMINIWVPKNDNKIVKEFDPNIVIIKGYSYVVYQGRTRRFGLAPTPETLKRIIREVNDEVNEEK